MLFEAGAVARAAYYLSRGLIVYAIEGQSEEVGENRWISEPRMKRHPFPGVWLTFGLSSLDGTVPLPNTVQEMALWTPWMHLGDLTTGQESYLAVLQIHDFIDAVPVNLRSPHATYQLSSCCQKLPTADIRRASDDHGVSRTLRRSSHLAMSNL